MCCREVRDPLEKWGHSMPDDSAERSIQPNRRDCDRRRAWLTAGICLAITTVLLGLPTLWPPGTHSWYPRCLFHAVTGGYCLTCGGTRALSLLGRGHLLQALHMNAVVVVGVATVCYTGLAYAVYGLGGPAPLLPRITSRRLLLLGVLLLAFWLARNVPFEPFRGLAPR